MKLPGYAAQEFRALASDGGDVARAWTGRSRRTQFRRDMLPHQDRDDPDFRILVPMSGGLDSATCHRMAVEAGLPVEPILVDTGVDYVHHDAAAAARLVGAPVRTITLPQVEWETASDFQTGRNSLIVWALLAEMDARGWWGEVWFGNLGGNYLETPIIGGDKSFRWLSAMQHLATAHGYDARIASPLGGMSKADAVSWWAARGLIDVALTARSCFADMPGQCGRCWACLYRYVAFTARGYREQVEATYEHGIDFAESAAEFWRRATTWRLVTTQPRRLGEVEAVLDSLGLSQAWWWEQHPVDA